MNMKKYFGVAAALTLTSAFIVTGCGAADNATAPMVANHESKSYDTMTESSAVYEEAAEDFLADTENATQTESVQQSSRKLITTININAETEDFDASKKLVENKVRELSGYIENSSVYNDDRSASYTIRIPSDRLDSFIDYIEGSNNITNKSVNVEDITLSYADTESRKKALRTEEQRLLKILESAETVEDLITVETRLSEVRYEIESIESRLRTYDNKVDYATVYLYLQEVEKYTPAEKQSATTRMGEGFVASLVSIKNGFVEFAVWFVVHIPQLILLGILAVIVIVIIRTIDKKNKKMRMAAYMQYTAAQQQQPIPPVEGNNGK